MVKVDDLEDHPDQYLGKRIKVSGAVDKVLGPRAFTIDEPGWIDLQGETLVRVASPLAVPVREGTMVTVEGTVKPDASADLAGTWGWLSADRRTELALERKPVLMADRVFGTNDNVAFIIDSDTTNETPSTGQTLTRADAIVDGTDGLIGRHVMLDGVAVAQTADQGFFIKSGDEYIFALPARPHQMSAGTTLKLEGFVMQMPEQMRDRLNGPDETNGDIYLYVVRTS